MLKAYLKKYQLVSTSLVLFGYSFVTFILTYPLALKIRTFLPADGNWDVSTQIWNTWWVRNVISEGGLNLFYTKDIVYPIGVELAFHNFLMNSFMTDILSPIFSQTASFNLAFLLSFVLSGYGMYLLIDHLIDNKMAAFMGGLIFAFSPYRFSHGLSGHMDLIHTEWMPFFILYMLKTVDTYKKSYAVAAGIFLFMVSLSDYNYTIYLIIFSLIALVYIYFCQRESMNLRKLSTQLAILFSVFLILFSPVLNALYSSVRSNEFESAPGWKGADVFIADLMGYVTPPENQPVFGALFAKANSKFIGNPGERTVFIGWLVMGLSAYALIRKRIRQKTKLWIYTALIFFILSLGPLLYISGKVWPQVNWFEIDGVKFGIPLPYTLFHFIPFLNEVRCPARFNLMVMLSLSVLCSYSFADILGRLQPIKKRIYRQSISWLLLFAISAIIIIEFHPGKFPIWNAGVPKIYKDIAKEKNNYTILEIPLGWRDGSRAVGSENTRLQYFQTIHNKPIINGTTSRIPEWKTMYFFRVPIIGLIPSFEASIESVTGALDHYVIQEQPFTKEVVRFLNLKYIIIHPPYINHAVDSYVVKVFSAKKVFDTDDIRVYLVDKIDRTAPATIDMGSRLFEMYAVSGWDAKRSDSGQEGYVRSNNDQPFILIPPPAANHQSVVLTMKMAENIELGEQYVSLSINDKYLKTINLSKSWKEYEIDIPQKYLSKYNTKISFSAQPDKQSVKLDIKTITVTFK